MAPFTDVTVGQTSFPFTTKVRNKSAAAVGPLTVAVTGDAADFVIDATGCEGTTLAPDGECAVVVHGKPTVAGERKAVIRVSDADDATATTTFEVSVVGLAPGALSFEPAMHDFRRIQIGANGTQTFMLRNSGDVAVTGLGLAVTTGAGFTVDPGDCGATLAAGATCQAIVTFQPGVGGTANGSLTASGDGVQAPSQLTGKGYGVIIVIRSGDGAAQGTLGGATFTCDGNRCRAEVDTATAQIDASASATVARFTTWATPCDTRARCTVPVDRASRDLTVTFRTLVRLEVTVIGAGLATAPDLTCVGRVCSGYYVKDTTVTVTGTWTGRNRLEWHGCTASGTTCAVTMSAARAVTAEFIARFVVTGLLPSGDSPWGDLYERPSTPPYINVRHGLTFKEFDANHSLELFAEGYPTLGSAFDRWTPGPCADQGAVCTFLVTQDVTIGAFFRPI